MPYVDNNLVMSDSQLMTVTAVSTKSIDTQSALRNLGSGEEIDLVVSCTGAFAGGTSLQVSLQDSADNTTFNDVVAGPAVVLASLVAGFELLRITLPRTLRRYIAMNYTIVGTMSGTGSTLTAYLTDDRQDNVGRPSGFTVF